MCHVASAAWQHPTGARCAVSRRAPAVVPFVYGTSWISAFLSTTVACGGFGLMILTAFHSNHDVAETDLVPYAPGIDWGEHQLNTTINVDTWYAGAVGALNHGASNHGPP
jgi:hypothetical protein